MDIRHLRYFVAIAEEGKILQAAQRLNIAQPPLSKQLSMLEEELGVKLFERRARRLVITEDGKWFYERAKEILAFIDGSMDELKARASGIKGTLSIGATASLGAELLPPGIREFRNCYPDVQFQIWEGDPNHVMELVEKRVVELGIVRLPVDTQLFETLILPEEPIVIVMSKKRDFAKGRAQIEVTELKDQPLMLLRRQKSPITNNQDTFISDMITLACLQHGFKPNIICESNDISMLLSWTLHDIGITAVPRSALKLMPGAGLVTKEIREPSLMARPPALIWLKGGYLSAVARKFMDFLPFGSAQTS